MILLSLVMSILLLMFTFFMVFAMLELFAPFELFVLFMFFMFLGRSPVFGNISMSVIKFVGWILVIIWSAFFFSRGASVQRLF